MAIINAPDAAIITVFHFFGVHQPPLPSGAEADLLQVLSCRHPTRIADAGGQIVQNGTSGTGRIYGDLTVAGQPESRRVILIHARSWLPVDEAWSDPVTGWYEFKWLNVNERFVVVAQDYALAYNGVIADQVQPEPM